MKDSGGSKDMTAQEQKKDLPKVKSFHCHILSTVLGRKLKKKRNTSENQPQYQKTRRICPRSDVTTVTSWDTCKITLKSKPGLNNIFNLLLETTHEFHLLVLQRKYNTEKH